MSNDPIKTLTDTLTLLRVEIADVKKRQITEERLKHLQAALEDNAEKIAGVQNAASQGAGKARPVWPILWIRPPVRCRGRLMMPCAASQRPVERPQARFWPVGATSGS